MPGTVELPVTPSAKLRYLFQTQAFRPMFTMEREMKSLVDLLWRLRFVIYAGPRT